ncbi:hypothetical protein GINT2_000413 [Glugoides intestinalis]
MNIKLNSGKEIPMIGIGTWQLEGQVLAETLEHAYNTGYRHIDTATCYKNEEVIGEFLKKHDRKEFFITTKLWNTDHDSVLEALETSLSKLCTDYVDLYLIHWPVNFEGKFDVEGVWKKMEQLVDLKKAKAIGVSNFGISNLKKILSICRIKPAANQIELHPYLPQNEILNFCNDENIQIKVISYSSLGSSSSGDPMLSKDPVLNAIALTHDCTVQSVILNFLISQGIPVIPRSRSKEHLKSNFERIELAEDEKVKIREIQIRHRYIDPKAFGEHRFD